MGIDINTVIRKQLGKDIIMQDGFIEFSKEVSGDIHVECKKLSILSRAFITVAVMAVGSIVGMFAYAILW